MNFQDLRIIIRQIKKNINCPKCKGKYSDQDIEVIGTLGDEHTFFHAVCPKCEAEAVINVAIQMNDMEINIPELKKLANNISKEKVSINEILDIHNFLDNFDGDFKDLFRVTQS